MISCTKEVCPLVSTLLNILTNELGAGEGQSLVIERSSPLSGNLERFFLILQPPRKQKFDFQTPQSQSGGIEAPLKRHPGKKKTRISVVERLALKNIYVKRNVEDTSSLR